MDIESILAQLKNHRSQLDEAIHSLELMTVGQKRRGRPPKWVSQITADNAQPKPKRRGRPRKAA